MKHDYKIKIDPPMPSEEQISRHKDFDRLYGNYQKITQPIYRKPLYKNPRAFIGLVLIATIGFLVFEAIREEEKATDTGNNTSVSTPPPTGQDFADAERQAFMKSPVPALAPKAFLLDLDLQKGEQIRLPDGTTLSIPAQAFETSELKPAQGTANLELRLLRDPLDHILAGFPIQAAGSRPIHITASIQLRITQNGIDLHLKQGQAIAVSLPLGTQPQPLEYLRLDEEEMAWTASGLPALTPQKLPAAPSKSNEDGFGIVEFGPDGKVVRKTQPSPQSKPQAQSYHLEFSLHNLETITLAQSASPGGERERPVQFADPSGQNLNLYAVYVLSKDQQQASVFWPQTASFVHTIRWNPSKESALFAFLPDGKVAWTSTKNLDALDGDDKKLARVLLQTSTTPIQEKSALMQLLGI